MATWLVHAHLSAGCEVRPDEYQLLLSRGKVLRLEGEVGRFLDAIIHGPFNEVIGQIKLSVIIIITMINFI